MVDQVGGFQPIWLSDLRTQLATHNRESSRVGHCADHILEDAIN